MSAQCDHTVDVTANGAAELYRITVVSAGVSDPSSTTRLGEAVAHQALGYLHDHGHEAEIGRVDLRGLSGDIARASVGDGISADLQRAIDEVAASDGLVAASPIFKASYSGLFKSFWDVTDTDVVLDMPVALTATGGSARHALMPDTAMRSLFAFLHAIPVPTSLVAAGKDWDSEGLSAHEKRAGEELGVLILLGARRAILEAAGSGYRHGVGLAHASGD
ncbi:CE1759 family FMN reductase [Bifidobacterium mongoliense]|uniref:Flavoprotein n=1 Tax=Bifidobacterium mongoliense TaxID=518643 RepID=A0A423UEC0_9BIFI|nr:CE1759 family FMN reductase [Bifidobacterium mongoliense]ROT87065.1 flavoprotein [Bifidobacterium mongoliense]